MVTRPEYLPKPFADLTVDKNVIPENPIPGQPGYANLDEGFPPITKQPTTAGGLPPLQQDFNGALNYLYRFAQWKQAGGQALWDVRVDEYPINTIVFGSDNVRYQCIQINGSATITVDPTIDTELYWKILSGKDFIVNDISDLRKINFGRSCDVLGYDSSGDGKGGPKRVLKTGAAPGFYVENGGTVIWPDLGDGSSAWIIPEAGTIDALWFGIQDGGVFDNTVKFQAMSAAHNNLTVSGGPYLTTDKINIKTGQVWNMQNASFIQNGTNFTTVFEADNISDWAILGRTTCFGTLATGADVGAEKGLVIKGGSRYRVEGFISRIMRSHGISFEASVFPPAPRGDEGQFTDCGSYQCRTGIEIPEDSSLEFNVFSNFNAAGCIDGAIIGAGNSQFIGGNIVDNEQGVTLTAGGNHAHGSFVGTQINHNEIWNLKTISVINGHTFSACHFYGNGGATAPIWFENSKGMNIDGGIIDCAIRCDGATGQNAITNNFIPTTTPALFGSHQEYLRILNNWTAGGAWSINDGASEYSLVTRLTTAQPIPLGTTLIFNLAEKDKRSLYNITTGVYTVPTDGVYAIKTAFTVTGTGFLAAGASYVQLEKNGASIAFFPITPVSDTTAIGSGSLDLALFIGDTIELVSQAAGTSPELAANSSRLVIELDQ